MNMKNIRYIVFPVLLMLFMSVMEVSAQPLDRRDVRRGNRDFRKENYREAEIDYRKALVKDSTSIAANYNLASTLYREGDMQQAQASLDRIKESAPMTAAASDYWYNKGDVALALKDYKTAVDAFAQSLILNPGDLDAKENYIYAKLMLQNQQNQQNQDNQNQQDNQDNQDQDQNQDNQDQDQNQDKNDQNKDNQDQNNDKDQKDQNQNNDQQDQQDKQDQNQGQQPKISPQAAQQMLQAIQAKEKETQDKVNEKKAQDLKSRQKDKNW